jgi:hypothetical protein
MAELLGYPCVSGELGILTKNMHVVQAVNTNGADAGNLTEEDFAEIGVHAGDVCLITFKDGKSDLYKVVGSPTFALKMYTPAT